MKLLPHVAASSVAGVAVWAVTGELLAIPAALAGGVLPDGDHVLDYYVRYIRGNRKRVFLLLHGWEYLALGVGLYVLFQPGEWAIGLLAGYATQIGGDQIFNRVKWDTYLVTSRAAKRFDRWRVLERGDDHAYMALVDSMPFGRDRLRRWFEERERMSS